MGTMRFTITASQEDGGTSARGEKSETGKTR
jgi:hypothetical protein